MLEQKVALPHPLLALGQVLLTPILLPLERVTRFVCHLSVFACVVFIIEFNQKVLLLVTSA